MNFKLPCSWIEKGRKCVVYIKKYGVVKAYDAEIVECSIVTDNDWQWCMCRLNDNSLHWIHHSDLEPIYTVEEIMQYADKTIIEEHWIDFNGDERALYLKKFDGEYFRIDEYSGSRKMERIKI